ncbi:MAG TPA: hypothetical protein DDW49_04590, partial [Deltaproteobacteria bacterium]|nr:hypothetical protein [Deltaproteobacteria bacterium]
MENHKDKNQKTPLWNSSSTPWRQGLPWLLSLVFIFTLSSCSLFSSPDKLDSKMADDAINEGPADDDVTPGGSGGPGNPGAGGDRVESPEEACTSSEQGLSVVSPNPIQFGDNELTPVENIDQNLDCKTITVTGCVPFSAEIDSTVEGRTPATFTDRENDKTYPQFVLRNGGSVSENRLTGLSDSVEVCYRRLANSNFRNRTRTDEGFVNIRVESANYARRLKLEGTTLPLLFNITAPQPGNLVWEGTSGQPQYDDPAAQRNRNSPVAPGSRPYLHFFNIQARGRISDDRIIKDRNLNISVQSDGLSVDVPLEEDGQFNKTIEIPYRPIQTYNVVFCLNTNTHNGKVCKSIPVVRYTAPQGIVQVTDGGGVAVTSLSETKPSGADNRDLQLKVNFSNLPFSGRQGHPVRISIQKSILAAGQPPRRPENNNEREVIKDCPAGNQNLDCNGRSCLVTNEALFDPETDPNDNPDQPNPHLTCPETDEDRNSSFCHQLNVGRDLVKGLNRFTVQACNDFTESECGGNCVTFDTTLIMDNDKPNITCTEIGATNVGENRVYTENTSLFLECTVENYKPPITQSENADEQGQCFVKLWVNTPNFKETDKESGYEICPEVLVGVDPRRNEGNFGNIRRGYFKIRLVPQEDDEGEVGDAGNNRPRAVLQKFGAEARQPVGQVNKLTRFTNILQIMAVDANGHYSFKTISFQRGRFGRSTFDNAPDRATKITTHKLGTLEENGKTKRTPLMLYLAEGIIKDPVIIQGIEKALNDPDNEALQFGNVVQGGFLPGDENNNNIQDNGENISFENGLDIIPGGDFMTLEDDDPNDVKKKRNIWENLHATMPQKYNALIKYRILREIREDLNPHLLDLIVFEGQCGGRSRDDILNFTESWDVACDSCNNLLSTAIVPYKMFQFVYKGFGDNSTDFLEDETAWPVSHMSNINACQRDPDSCRANLNFDDTVQGKWRIGQLEVKANGYIDADVCILGDGEWVDRNRTPDNPCDDVPGEGNHSPAFWGSAAAIGLVEGGVTGVENDPLIPIIWNVGKIRLNLRNVLQLTKVRINGTYTNKLVIHKENIDIDLDHDNISIQLEPYHECARYYRAHYNADFDLPLGCREHGEVFPILMDLSSPLGRLLKEDVTEDGNNLWLLGLLQEKVLETFKNILSCIGDEKINPLINPEAFPYLPWVPEDDQDDFSTAAIDEEDGEAEFELPASDATNPIFNIKMYLSEADIGINDDGISLKLPLQIGANQAPGRNFASNSGLGYMFRNTSANNFERRFPLHDIANAPYLGTSVAIEELINSLTHLVFHDGPFSRLNLLSKDLKEDLQPINGWTIGIDNVILGNFDICENVAGIISTGLPPDTIASNLSNLFADGSLSHFDITLDRNHPPTLALLPLDAGKLDALGAAGMADLGFDLNNMNSAILQVGLTNVTVTLKSLERIGEGNHGAGSFRVGNEVAQIRLDALLKIGIKYKADTKQIRIELFIQPDSVFYLSVVPGHGAGTFDDHDVISGITGVVLETALGKLAKDIYAVPSEDQVLSPSFAINLPTKLEYFDNESVFIKGGNVIPGQRFDKAETYRDDLNLTRYTLRDGANGPLKRIVIQDLTTLEANTKCDNAD